MSSHYSTAVEVGCQWSLPDVAKDPLHDWGGMLHCRSKQAGLAIAILGLTADMDVEDTDFC